MIATDTSTFIAFNAGEAGIDVDRLIESMQSGLVVLPPTVLAEMLSDPKLPISIEAEILKIPILEIQSGYWERVGKLRRSFLKRGQKSRLADAEIAQSCLDAKIPLITRDKDFKKYSHLSDLKLILGP